MEITQLAFTAGLFGVLGAAITWRWLKHTGRLTDSTRKRIWFRTLFGAVALAGGWVLLNVGLEALPDRWSRLLPLVFLIGLVLTSYRKPPQVTDVEQQSTHRIQIGILIGGILLGVFFLILNLFW